MLWADPVKQDGKHPSKRGVSIGFGPDVTEKFLNDNNLGNLSYIRTYCKISRDVRRRLRH